MLLQFLLLLHGLLYLLACERGLTQLRHRDTLALMRCVPTLPGHPDPCIVQTGGRMSWCQPETNDQFVCCGTQELLVQLLAGKNSGRTSNSEWRSYPPSSSQFDYNVVIRSTLDSRETSAHVVTTPRPYSSLRMTTSQPRKTSMHTMAPSSSLLSFLSVPSIVPGNFSHSVRVSSNVVAVRDGRCTIVVNTGMPHQKAQIIQNLGAAGISARDVQFVVITSSLPQFIGNLNLFPNAQIVYESHFLYKEHVIQGGIEQNVHVEMCSPLTYLLSTPGPSSHSVSLIVRNVPSMGTVAIAGAIFSSSEDTVLHVSDEFSEDPLRVIEARMKLICQSDWIVPAHAAAFPVTASLRRVANCSQNKTKKT